MNNRFTLSFLLLLNIISGFGQTTSEKNTPLSKHPPMGWMTWNYFGDNIHEKDIKQMADAMVESGMSALGYQYIFIDDGWQGGRDNKNNIIPDPEKFPSGIKALADYVHGKGLKLGIYSDAAQLTCAGYTASLNFENQDAKTFASWGIDYLKYDYCNAPADSATAKIRYKRMADALRQSGRDIAFGVCEWGGRHPWKWASSVGGQVWRTTGDIRDKWKDTGTGGYGILDIIDANAELDKYAVSGGWNDMDMLIAGLYGKKGPSGDLGGTGCSDIEYQTQMSIWCMMSSPLATSNDIRNMNDATKRILLNKEIIDINQDASGKQCQQKIKDKVWNIFTKELANGDYALAILNRSDTIQNFKLVFDKIGLTGKYEIRDVWEHKSIGHGKKWNGQVKKHETKVFRLRKI